MHRKEIEGILLQDANAISLKFDKEFYKNNEILYIYENKFLNICGIDGIIICVNDNNDNNNFFIYMGEFCTIH